MSTRTSIPENRPNLEWAQRVVLRELFAAISSDLTAGVAFRSPLRDAVTAVADEFALRFVALFVPTNCRDEFDLLLDLVAGSRLLGELAHLKRLDEHLHELDRLAEAADARVEAEERMGDG